MRHPHGAANVTENGDQSGFHGPDDPRSRGRRPELEGDARAALNAPDRTIDCLDGERAQFVREYLLDCNVSAASRRMGFSRQRGHQLIGEPIVQLAIAEEQAERAARLEVSADKVVEELASIAFSDITDYVDIRKRSVSFKSIDKITPSQRRAIAEIRTSQTGPTRTIQFKLYDKMKALTKLCDHLGIAIRRHILQGDAAGGPIRTERVPLPPAPTTIEEWEEQVRRAEARRPQEGTLAMQLTAGEMAAEAAEEDDS